MKKVAKRLVFLSAAFVGVAFYTQQKQKNKQALYYTVLQSAKQYVQTIDTPTGSWLNMTPEYSQQYQSNVLTGGITTKTQQFLFIADARTGELLLIEEE